MEAAADEAADVLAENLSSPSHGAGVHYPRLPNQSSAPGQMPVMQSGDLAEGVTSQQDATGTGAQVVIQDKFGKLLGLEFSPPSTNPNAPPGGSRQSGGRAPMWETMMDERTQEAMRRRVREEP
ncbi:MAG: hypothetical protein WCY60_01850 [Trueperaceae bacterium]